MFQNGAAAAAGPGGSLVGDVPGFGTNSSIHELFGWFSLIYRKVKQIVFSGKMVWRKMEGLRDQQVIDRLQNRIMNLIHDALADQNGLFSLMFCL